MGRNNDRNKDFWEQQEVHYHQSFEIVTLLHHT